MNNNYELIKENLKKPLEEGYTFVSNLVKDTEHELITYYKDIVYKTSPHIIYVITIPNIFGTNFDYKIRVIANSDIINENTITTGLGLKAKEIKFISKHTTVKDHPIDGGLVEKADPAYVIAASIMQFIRYVMIKEIRKADAILLSPELTRDLFLLSPEEYSLGNFQGYILPEYLGANTYNPNMRIATMLLDTLNNKRTEYHSKEILRYKRNPSESQTHNLTWENLDDRLTRKKDYGKIEVDETIFDLIKEATGYDLQNCMAITGTLSYNPVTANEIIDNYLEYYFQTMETRAVINYIRRWINFDSIEVRVKVKKALKELVYYEIFQLSRINDNDKVFNNYEFNIKSTFSLKLKKSLNKLIYELVQDLKGEKAIDAFEEEIQKRLEEVEQQKALLAAGEITEITIPTIWQGLNAYYEKLISEGHNNRELKAIALYSKLFEEKELDNILFLYHGLEEKREEIRLKIFLDNFDLSMTEYAFLKAQLDSYTDWGLPQLTLGFKTERRLLADVYEKPELVEFYIKDI